VEEEQEDPHEIETNQQGLSQGVVSSNGKPETIPLGEATWDVRKSPCSESRKRDEEDKHINHGGLLS